MLPHEGHKPLLGEERFPFHLLHFIKNPTADEGRDYKVGGFEPLRQHIMIWINSALMQQQDLDWHENVSQDTEAQQHFQ